MPGRQGDAKAHDLGGCVGAGNGIASRPVRKMTPERRSPRAGKCTIDARTLGRRCDSMVIDRAMLVRDPPRDREPEPSALRRSVLAAAARRARRVAAIEPLEDVRQLRRLDADARVRDREHRAGRRARTPTRTEPPAGVNLIALSSRIIASCRSSVGSPSTAASSNVIDLETHRLAFGDRARRLGGVERRRRRETRDVARSVVRRRRRGRA